ncbi:autotransporter-associated beta strand repeat protein [Chthoniobacter flavus Ellin428]|uniref:Autotransporter-associated beta strand repeat protein n=1 Tax=Chthoniobacter flavus Ellin428 TaxID=497964 RepID=B4CYB6_9BACT|nr:autotransporter-associated beta strand repeat-containing protein [Chthoniobacter flavus]EDY20457.1 autotransporter-associated beta strand repeat protein [Chthoniobacter flavus Ellin428]TCO85599.1 putative secreted protein with PEP-CTERM sorting signal [Chthoniobacter flavus]
MKTPGARRLLITSILTVPIWVAAVAALNFGAEAATTLTWDSNTGTSGAQDGSGTWNAGGTTWWNGTTDVATASDLTTNIALFGNAGTLSSVATVNVGTQSINGLLFGATTTNGYTLTNTAASTLTIGNGGITMNSGAQATTVGDPTNLSIALGAAQTWTNNSGNLLMVGGNVTNSTFLLTIAGSGAVSISGNIGSGTGGLTQKGTGTTTLSGANTYTGATTVNAGTLQVGNGTSGSIASTSPLALGGGTFSVLGNTTGTTSQTVASLAVNAGASAIVVNANGGSGTTLNVKAIARSVGGTIDFSGTGGTITSTANTTGGILGGYATFNGNTWAVANGASAITGLASYVNDTWASGNNTTVTLASNTAYNNVTTNSLRFNANAASTVTLSGTNVITTGGILVTSAVGSGNLSTITGGTLEGASGKDLVAIVNNAGGLSIGSIIANNTTATGLTVSGPGTLTLTAANTFTGATTVNGTLNLSNTLALQNSTLSVGAAGSVVFDSSVSTHAFTVAGLGGGNINLMDNAGTPNAVALTVGANNVNSSSSGVISGGGSLIKTGTGTLTLSGANTFTGGITVSGGLLSNGSGAATTNSLGTGPITVQNGGTLNFNSSRSLPVLGALTINGAGASGQPGALVAGGGLSFASFSFTSITLGSDSTIGAYSNGNGVTVGGTVNLGAFTLTLNPNAFAGAISLPGVISGTGGLTLNGSGDATHLASTATATLSGANNYTGATTVTVGTLVAGKATVGGASPISGAFGVNSTTTVNTGATLDLHGFVETLGSISGGGTITSAAAGTPTLTIGGDNTSPTFSGVIQNGTATSVALTKIGSGTQTLSGANTYTGATTVSAGTLVVSGSLNGTANVNVASGATLASGATGSITAATAGNIIVNGTLAPGGLGSVGTLTLALGAGSLSFASGSTLALDISGTNSGEVAFSSTGDWLLGSDNLTLSLSGLTPADYGNTYTVFHNVTTSGFNLAGITGYDTADYLANFNQVGSDYQLSFTAIPEPSAFASLFGGLGLLVAWRRRNRQRRA